MMYVVDSHQNVVRRMFSYRIGSIRIRSDQIGSKRIILDQIGSIGNLSCLLPKSRIKALPWVRRMFYRIGSIRIRSDQNGSDRIGSISNSSCLLPKSQIKAWQWRPRSLTAPRRWRPGCHKGQEPEGWCPRIPRGLPRWRSTRKVDPLPWQRISNLPSPVKQRTNRGWAWWGMNNLLCRDTMLVWSIEVPMKNLVSYWQENTIFSSPHYLWGKQKSKNQIPFIHIWFL